MLQCRYHEDRDEETVFHDLRRCGTGQIGRLMSRVYFTSRQRSHGCGNTKIGPALEGAISHHQGRYGIEIMIESLFGDESCSWVMLVIGINKYVTEMTEEPKTTTSVTFENLQGNLLLQQDRNKHPRLLCHIICVFGLTWNQVRTTRGVSNCQKR